MKLPRSLALALCTFCSLGTLAVAQQRPQPLPLDHYLVATQGWVNSKISNNLNTIQVISPYTGKAKVLNVQGIPAGEAPASLVIQSPVSFLVGSKSLSTQAASGNLYRVLLQTNNTWRATRVNRTALPINASDIVVYNNNVYVIGSRVFGKRGNDAQILRINLRTGVVATHLLIGDLYKAVRPVGAMGLGSALVLVGTTLHVFTFDTTLKTGQNNEHWTVSTSLPVQARKLPSLPLSRRMQGVSQFHGFGTSGAFIDPENSQGLVVVGRWGEIVWRDLKGNNRRYEGFAGRFTDPYKHLGELWRGIALNTNTRAFGLGDHNGASIDERRVANSPKAKEPFCNDIAKAIQPKVGGVNPKVLFTISGMAYIKGPSHYKPVGAGCADGTNGIPRSYASGAPARGNPSFGFNLHARPQGASRTTVGLLLVSAKKGKVPLGTVAPGCVLHLDLKSLIPFSLVASRSNSLAIGPVALPGQKLKLYTQWALVAPWANKLGIILSDARELGL